MSEPVEMDSAVRLFCSFRTEGRLYGIDATQVREVSAQIAFTPVPQAPPTVRGLANLRSRIYLVVDIRPVLGLAPTACTSESRLMILKPHLAENLGVLVEHGGDIVRARVEEIEETLSPAVGTDASASDREPTVITGVCKLESELMNIIDAARIVEVVEAGMK